MIKTPLSTAIGGVGMYTKNSLIIGGGKTEPPFDPASLFENGEIGTLLDATDLSGIYQDTLRDVLAQNSDLVGLILDKSKKLTIGSELQLPAYNLWAKSSLVTSVEGSTVTCSGAGGIALTSGLEVGAYYDVELEYTSDSNQSIGLFDSNNTSSLRPIKSSNTGSIQVRYLTSATGIYVRTAGAASFTIKAFKIRKVTGAPAYQIDSAKKPLLQNDIKFDGIDDTLNITFPNALTNCTIFTVKHGGQAQILEAQSVAQNHVINTDFKYYGIVNRALTSAERAGLISYLNKLGAQ